MTQPWFALEFVEESYSGSGSDSNSHEPLFWKTYDV